MHQNSSLYETYYLRSTRNFIDECQKRGLKITPDFLEECAQNGFIKPVILKDKMPYYDLFQVPLVAEVLAATNYGVKSVAMAKKLLKTRLACFEKTLPLLYQVRYFYFRKMFRFISSQVLPPYPITKEQAKNYLDTFSEIYYDFCKKYKPLEFAEKYKLDKRLVQETSHDIFVKGHIIDPVPDLYTFIRAIRRTDSDKLKHLKGKALLAQDYYIQAEMLQLFYKDAFGEDILALEDVFDGRAGQWKIRKCKRCERDMKIENSRQKYCRSCRVVIANNKKVTFKCGGCGKAFYNYVDGDEVVDHPIRYKSKDERYGRKLPAGETITITRLEYGRMIVMAQCSCGRFNREVIEKGWY